MEDAGDDHLFPYETIEYPMPPINDATDVRAVCGPRLAEIGEPAQSLKRVTDATLIRISDILAKLLSTISADIGEIGARCLA